MAQLISAAGLAIAQSFVPGSYISLESALAYHGWIPEAAFVTASVSPGRKTMRLETGNFRMFGVHPLAIAPYRFLTAVNRVTINKTPAFVAQPLRALIDLVGSTQRTMVGHRVGDMGHADR